MIDHLKISTIVFWLLINFYFRIAGSWVFPYNAKPTNFGRQAVFQKSRPNQEHGQSIAATAKTITSTNVTEVDSSFIVGSLEKHERDSFATALLHPQQHFESLPFGLIVGQTEVKQALVLAACNPRLGGVILEGPKGTGKSILARAIHRLLPPDIERVKGSLYNTDPRILHTGSMQNENTGGGYNYGMVDSILSEQLLQSRDSPLKLETEKIATPLVVLPLNCQEDGLLGRVDLEESITTGQTIFEPGLMARAHRGVLLVDDINLLEEGLANLLLNSLADGFVSVEREGLSVQYPCHPLLVATYNPDEGEMREHLLDRIAISLPVDPNLELEERVRVVMNVEGFQDKTISLQEALEEEKTIRRAIMIGKELLPNVNISHEQISYLCKEATRGECEGQRAEIFAAEIAKTAAAIDGRSRVLAKDLQLGVLLAILPRSRVFGVSEEGAPPQQQSNDQSSEPEQKKNQQQLMHPPPMSPPPPEPQQAEKDDQETEDQTEDEQNNEDKTNKPELEEQKAMIPEIFMIRPTSTSIDPRVMRFKQWTKKGKGGKRSQMFNLNQGRFVKAIFPKGDWRKGRLAVAATLRAAAPHQKYRRAHAIASGSKKRHVYIDNSDFRIKRLAKKSGSLIIFVVDASGSMALNRMDAAKGAALSLLQEAYKSRDKICLIAFHGEQGEVLVPPTKSMALTRSRLEAMPCGGRSPLAHGLMLAVRIGLSSLKVKQDVGKVVIVLISDGRPTVPLQVSEEEDGNLKSSFELEASQASRKFCRDEVCQIAKTIGTLKDFNFLVIDTEDRYVASGISAELARQGQGSYHQLRPSDVTSISKITRHATDTPQKIIRK